MKYRFWDTENKRWFKPVYKEDKGKLEELLITQSGELCLRKEEAGVITFTPEHHCPNRFIKSMYSGMKARCGKKIYEGDIRREETEYNHGDIRTYFVCAWIKELAMFSWLTIEEYIEYTAEDPQEFDVIFDLENPYSLDITHSDKYVLCGNVYQNPKLLNYQEEK